MSTTSDSVPVLKSGKIRLEGIVSLLLTPLDEDQSIDWGAYDTYVAWQAAQDPAGLFAVCGSSEMRWLTLDERLALARRAVAMAESVPVLATANLEADAASHREEIERMAEAGVRGVVLIPQAGLAADPGRYRDYFLGLIEHSPVPVFLYEWPQVENHLLDPGLVADIAPYVSGIKDTTCTMAGIRAKLAVAGDTVIYQANTPYLLDAIAAGAHGSMAITSTCCPDLAIALWKAVQLGDESRATSLHRELVLLDSLLVRSYPLTAKYLAAQRGLPIKPVTRWPGRFDAEFGKALDVWLAAYPLPRLA